MKRKHFLKKRDQKGTKQIKLDQKQTKESNDLFKDKY